MTNVPNELQNLNPRPKFDAWHMTQRLLAMLLLIAMAPLLLILYVLVKADSRGPFPSRLTRFDP
jgi:lipopolysaccharide/colanic/teichoic acid biosynthesis glycosyltransferase